MPGTTVYLVLAEVADLLGCSLRTAKIWVQRGILPGPDATFGHYDPDGHLLRAWQRDRISALMGEDNECSAGHDRDSTPTHYLTVAGVAERLQLPLSTVKWWAAEGSLPAPDARAGRSAGWLEQTVVDWWAREVARRRPRRTARRVQVLVESGPDDSLACAEVAVFDSRDAALRELAQRYRESADADVAVSDAEASAHYLAERAGRSILREAVVYR